MSNIDVAVVLFQKNILADLVSAKHVNCCYCGGMGVGWHLAAGSIAIKDVADLYMYPNTVAAVQVSGAVRQPGFAYLAPD